MLLLIVISVSCKKTIENTNNGIKNEGIHPNLILTSQGVKNIRAQLGTIPIFDNTLKAVQKEIDGEKAEYGPSLAFVGLLEGLVTGIVGAGGGFLIIPALVLLGKLSMKKAIASSLFIITIKSLVGFGGDLLHVNVDWKFLSIIIVLATLGIITGNYLNKTIDGAKLKKGFGWFVLFMSLVIILEQVFG